jgi:hypothetical protein
VTLVEVLKDPAKKQAVVRDGAQLIDDEVSSRSGLSGMAIKAGYKSVKAIKPGIIEGALHMLLPDFAPALDPFYEKGRAEGNVDAYFTKNAVTIAEAMLQVTDRRAQGAQNAVMKKVYQTLRGSAQKEVAGSVPRLAGLILRHVG